MTAKLTASADGTKVTIGTAAEDALQIDATAKTIAAVSPYVMQTVAPTAAGTSFTPAGNVAATNVQAAIQELDAEKQSLLGYVPVNRGGDTMSGNLTIQNATLTVSHPEGLNKSIQLGGQSTLGYPFFWSPEGVVHCASELLLPSIPSTANAANCHIATGENNAVYLSTSSRRFKNNIKLLVGYPKFDQIQPVVYNSLHKHDGPKEFLGFIAEDLHKVDARLGDGDTFYDDRAMIAILFAKVKELSDEVADLKKAK
jgi:Chaperone of endosialidase